MKTDKAVKYFKQERGFHRLMTQLIKKYQQLGRIGGSIKLSNLSDTEKEALASLMRRDYSKQQSATITMTAFEAALQKTRFAGITLKELLDGYAGQQLTTNEELRHQYQREKHQFFNQLIQLHKHDNCCQWLEHILAKGVGTRGIHLAYDVNAPLLYLQLTNVLKALAQLPALVHAEYDRLPIFASRVTGDPHGFDLDTDQGRFLIAALHYLRQHKEVGYTVSANLSAEEKTELLAYYGLIRDDLLNFVTCAGIVGLRQNKPTAIWRSACEEAAVLNVPLREIVKIETFLPAVAYSNTNKEKIVFMLENSGVFSAVLDHFNGKEMPPLICTHGQLKLANLILLDKLVTNGVTVLYSGDFDPEGLQMAQRILDRYGSRAKTWCYNYEDYLISLSEVELDDARLKKLDTVTTTAFTEVKEAMRQYKKAGYQEYLIKKLVADIESYMALTVIC
ncbi:TIGR02679 family protein [Peptococcaceae bacterium 1198_IL3148]